jgi:hypothetical protein
MKTILHRISIQTHHETELINITPQMLALVQASGIMNGTVFVLSLHTTTAITVNEGLPDLEKDIQAMIDGLVPEGLAGFPGVLPDRSRTGSAWLAPDDLLRRAGRSTRANLCDSDRG